MGSSGCWPAVERAIGGKWLLASNEDSHAGKWMLAGNLNRHGGKWLLFDNGESHGGKWLLVGNKESHGDKCLLVSMLVGNPPFLWNPQFNPWILVFTPYGTCL